MQRWRYEEVQDEGSNGSIAKMKVGGFFSLPSLIGMHAGKHLEFSSSLSLHLHHCARRLPRVLLFRLGVSSFCIGSLCVWWGHPCPREDKCIVNEQDVGTVVGRTESISMAAMLMLRYNLLLLLLLHLLQTLHVVHDYLPVFCSWNCQVQGPKKFSTYSWDILSPTIVVSCSWLVFVYANLSFNVFVCFLIYGIAQLLNICSERSWASTPTEQRCHPEACRGRRWRRSARRGGLGEEVGVASQTGLSVHETIGPRSQKPWFFPGKKPVLMLRLTKSWLKKKCNFSIFLKILN